MAVKTSGKPKLIKNTKVGCISLGFYSGGLVMNQYPIYIFIPVWTALAHGRIIKLARYDEDTTIRKAVYTDNPFNANNMATYVSVFYLLREVF